MRRYRQWTRNDVSHDVINVILLTKSMPETLERVFRGRLHLALYFLIPFSVHLVIAFTAFDAWRGGLGDIPPLLSALLGCFWPFSLLGMICLVILCRYLLKDLQFDPATMPPDPVKKRVE